MCESAAHNKEEGGGGADKKKKKKYWCSFHCMDMVDILNIRQQSEKDDLPI